MFMGFPMLNHGKAIRYPIHISNVADALMMLVSTQQLPVEGKTYELVGPRAYTYRRVVELFAHAAMCPLRITNLPPWAFWLYGRMFPEIRRTPFPYDTILQLQEDEQPGKGKGNLGMADLGFGRLETVEDNLLTIVRKYRRTDDYGTPIVFPPELLADSVITSNQPDINVTSINLKTTNHHPLFEKN